MTACETSGNPASGIVVSALGAVVQRCVARGNAGAGIVLPGANGLAARDVRVVGNRCEGNAFHGIQSDCIVTGPADIAAECTLEDNDCIANGTGGAGFGIYAAHVRGWRISANRCRGNLLGGVYLMDAMDVEVSGNRCDDPRAPGARTQRLGIRLEGTRVGPRAFGSARVSMRGNTVREADEIGIHVVSVHDEPLDDVLLAENVVTGCGRGIVADEATPGSVRRLVLDRNDVRGNGGGDVVLRVQDARREAAPSPPPGG